MSRTIAAASALAIGAGALAACTAPVFDGTAPASPGPGAPSVDPPDDPIGTDVPTTDGGGSAVTPFPSAPAPPGDAAAPLPQPSDQTCSGATETVTTVDELERALDAAGAGAVIRVADGTYEGNFVATASGTADAPIVLCGSRAAVLDGGSITGGYVLHLDGVAHWRIVGLTIRNGQKGLMADGVSMTVIEGVLVEDIGDEAIHLRSFSTDNLVVGNTIRRTGQRRDKFGEGVYVGSAVSNWENHSGGEPDRSDRNVVRDNDISETTSEAIDIKEGTTGGTVIGNRLDGAGLVAADSLIDLKGNGWVVEDNVVTNAAEEGIQTHRILEGWGTENVIQRNEIGVRGGGNHVYVHDPDETDNIVRCDNRTDDGGPIRSNVECAP